MPRLATSCCFKLSEQKNYDSIAREIPPVIAKHYSKIKFGDEFANTSEQNLLGLMIKCFGDSKTTRSKMVTHENLESLIPDLEDADGNVAPRAS